MELAKMMGITPVLFSLMGSVEFCPPYIFRPTTFFAYCTGRRRSELVINTMSITIRIPMITEATAMIIPSH